MHALRLDEFITVYKCQQPCTHVLYLFICLMFNSVYSVMEAWHLNVEKDLINNSENPKKSFTNYEPPKMKI